MDILDAKESRANEGGPSFSFGNRAFRAAWSLSWLLLAAWTPPPLHRWRNLVLRVFGAKIHPTARVYASARVWYPPNLVMGAHAVIGPGVECYCQGTVTVGERSIVSQRAYLCAGTHDISDPNFQLVTRPIVIEPQSWVAAEAFIGPGATVRTGAVIGARAVLFGNAESWSVYTGNPAKLLKARKIKD